MKKGWKLRVSVCALCCFASACGSREKPDPAKEALSGFRTFVQKAYPATPWAADGMKMDCKLARIDVVKSDSTASPYTGILEAEGTGTMTLKDPEPTDHAMKVGLKLKFTNEGGGWKCDETQSTVTMKVDDSDMPIKEACKTMDQMCKGVAPPKEK